MNANPGPVVNLLERKKRFGRHIHVPEVATSDTGLCCSWDMNPTTENMTKPAKKDVSEFKEQMMKVSLFNNKLDRRAFV